MKVGPPTSLSTPILRRVQFDDAFSRGPADPASCVSACVVVKRSKNRRELLSMPWPVSATFTTACTSAAASP